MAKSPFFMKIPAFFMLSILMAGCSSVSVPEPEETRVRLPTVVETGRRHGLPEGRLFKDLSKTRKEEKDKAEKPVRADRADDGAHRIGMLLPLAGAAAEVGGAVRNAAQMAQFEVGPESMVLQFYDTKGTADGAETAALKALSHDVDLILGPVFSRSVIAVAPRARDAGVNVVAFSSDPSATGRGVFTTGFLLQQQIKRIISYAYSNGRGHFAALLPANTAGRSMAEDLSRILEDHQAELVRTAFYDPRAKDYSNVVRRFTRYSQRKEELQKKRKKLEELDSEDEISKEALKRFEKLDTLGAIDFDAVLIPEEGSRLRSLAALLSYYDVSPAQVKFLGTTLWDDPSIGKEPALRGGWYPAPPKDLHEKFRTRYQALYGEAPLAIASLGYDAVALASVLIRGEKDAPFTVRALTNPNGFHGIDGIFRLLPNGRSERTMAVMEVQADGPRRIDPARKTFQRSLRQSRLEILP